ncbi:MAG: hypothetical protein J0I79_11675 [Mesorhizobium sp.]|uniref:hypothetical protein n=1 Tax=Mesorhizobium sp. TaxID=1871066 RepID=UPI001ACA82F0|nr:hypothetical protein [Mesorhizobium sp.]MBN9218603.1 hypothetical protein [Mesorhizobium sp.]
METTRRRTGLSARLRCRARKHYASGLFHHLADQPEEGKQTQPVSFVEKAGLIPGPSAYGLHMAEFAWKCKGIMLQRSKNRLKADACTPPRASLPQTQLPLLGTMR